eukprot:scaffold12993_cov96-Isochrysis_galbana.AAC.2
MLRRVLWTWTLRCAVHSGGGCAKSRKGQNVGLNMRLLLAKDRLSTSVVICLHCDRKWFIQSQSSLKQNSSATLRYSSAAEAKRPNGKESRIQE